MVEQANVKVWGKTAVTAETHPATATCAHPERWSMFDSETAELEVLKFLRSMVRTLKPQKVVTVGDPNGILTAFIGQALRENGAGQCIAMSIPDSGKEQFIGRVMGGGLQRWVSVFESEGEMPNITGLDLVILDGENAAEKAISFLPLIKRDGLLVVHDTADKPLGDVGDCQILYLPTPRGLSILHSK